MEYNNIYNSKQFDSEVKEKWGYTDSYKEYKEKSQNYSKEKWHNLYEEMNDIFLEFSLCLNNKEEVNSQKVQNLVQKLQNHITQNYYKCTNDILLNLGQIYILDERFTKNIDKYANETALYVNEAIKKYCLKTIN